MGANAVSTFGERIRDGMTMNGWSVAALAIRVGVSTKTVYRWRILKVAPKLDSQLLLVLSDALRCPGRYLIDGHESPLLRVRLSPDENYLIEYFRSLPPIEQQYLLDHITDGKEPVR